MSIVLATTPLLKMFYSSLAAVLAIACVFSVAILGAIRSADMRRAGRTHAALLFAALAAAGLVFSAAVVVYGLILVGHKG